MWKLLEPRSTAARTSGTARGAGRDVGRVSVERAGAAEAMTLWDQAAVNEEPQPQVVAALGLRITNCAPSSPSR